MMYESYSYYYKRRVLLIFLVNIEIWLNYGGEDAILSSSEALMCHRGSVNPLTSSVLSTQYANVSGSVSGSVNTFCHRG